jgi:PhnB protein
MSTNPISQKSGPRTHASASSAALQIQPYLFFDGRCEEALEFYRAALGAEIGMIVRFKDSPEQHGAAPGNKIMHADFTVGGSHVLASDGECTGRPDFQGFSLSLTVATAAEAERYFGRLAEGGQMRMPLGKTFFSEAFGMLEDKFGVGWMVYVKPAQTGA